MNWDLFAHITYIFLYCYNNLMKINYITFTSYKCKPFLLIITSEEYLFEVGVGQLSRGECYSFYKRFTLIIKRQPFLPCNYNVNKSLTITD